MEEIKEVINDAQVKDYKGYVEIIYTDNDNAKKCAIHVYNDDLREYKEMEEYISFLSEKFNHEISEKIADIAENSVNGSFYYK